MIMLRAQHITHQDISTMLATLMLGRVKQEN